MQVVGANGEVVQSVTRDTKIVRYEIATTDTPMTPHESPYFDISKAMEYRLKPDNYSALFFTSSDNLEVLEKLRRKQGYFEENVVLREATIGELLDNNPGAVLLSDHRFNGTVLGKDSGGYILVNSKTLKEASVAKSLTKSEC